jgi:hypothetical protein
MHRIYRHSYGNYLDKYVRRCTDCRTLDAIEPLLLPRETLFTDFHRVRCRSELKNETDGPKDR